MRNYLIIFFIFFSTFSYSQQTKVWGKVTDGATGEEIPFTRVRFKDSKISTSADSTGYYLLETYYATDSLSFSFTGYTSVTVSVKKDQEQELNIQLFPVEEEIEVVYVKPPDELMSTIIHKRVVANKKINNKEKLLAYDYELYNKMQLDLNNIGEKFKDRGFVKKLDVVMDYLDSTDKEKMFLPIMLSESIADFYFRNNPKKKKEIIQASKTTGFENIQVNQLLGDMYMDMNIYDNYINLFQRAFISPIAGNARSFYKFTLKDSSYRDDKWCYLLQFEPKRTGEMTFSGEMWIHDTTYAVKEIRASLSPWANINYVQDLYFEHYFEQVEKEVWMPVKEKMIIDIKLTKNTELYGFYARKTSTRRNFVINKIRPDEFFKGENTVEYVDSALTRTDDYWRTHRHDTLNFQEKGIDEMIDSLNNTRFFKSLKKLTYLAATGYYELGKVEVGDIYSLVAGNMVEKFRMNVALRTSNAFSKRLELGGNIAYGFGDQRIKGGAKIRYNITPKKRGMLTLYYRHDMDQLGLSTTASGVGSTFNTLLKTAPLDKLTLVRKMGIDFEKDIKKDFIIRGGFEVRELTPQGIADFRRQEGTSTTTVRSLTTSEFKLSFRWGKNEEFISGVFDRVSVGSKYPILTLEGTFGVKGIFGSQYDYQKVEFRLDHARNIGIIGRLSYGFSVGAYAGKAAYPFLKVHEGNQSYWYLKSAFNKLNYYEFISDTYATAYLEQHWQGLFFDRLPLIKKLKWRLVTSARITYGTIHQRHTSDILLPYFTRSFNKTPYLEVSAGIENIFKIFRVDVVYRVTHHLPGVNPFGVRVRWDIIF